MPSFTHLRDAALLGAAALWIAGAAQARPHRLDQLPNGYVHNCTTCHTLAFGGPRNPFGLEIENHFLDQPGRAGNVLWGPMLAALDSDRDGASNGAELLDPLGAWSLGDEAPGLPEDVTHPGVADLVRVPMLSPAGLVVLTSTVAGLGAIAAGRARGVRP